MLDSDFRFDGGDSDSVFGFDPSASSSDDEEVVNTSYVNEDVLVTVEIDDSSGDDEVVATGEMATKNDAVIDTQFKRSL